MVSDILLGRYLLGFLDTNLFDILGVFTMNMIRATGGSGGLSTSYTDSTGSVLSKSNTNDSNWPSVIYGLYLCGAFILLMPAGVVLLRVAPKSVQWHWVNQTLSSAIAIVGITN